VIRATSTNTRAIWSTSMSRSWGGFHPAVAGAFGGARADTRWESASTTSTPRWTITAGSPTPRSAAMNAAPRRRRSGHAHGILRAHGIMVQRVLTDNAFAYRKSIALSNRGARGRRGATLHPPAPTADQRQGGALQPNLARGMGLRSPYTSNQERAHALTPWLHLYNHHRTHTAWSAPPSHVSTTCLGITPRHSAGHWERRSPPQAWDASRRGVAQVRDAGQPNIEPHFGLIIFDHDNSSVLKTESVGAPLQRVLRLRTTRVRAVYGADPGALIRS